MRIYGRYFFLMPLLVLAHPFLLGGVWKPIQSPHQRFEFSKEKVTSVSDRGSSMTMDHEWEEGDPMVMRLSNLVIHKKPADWYNLSKYAKYVRYIRSVKTHGIMLRIRFLEEDRIQVTATIGDEDLPSFSMTRLPSE